VIGLNGVNKVFPAGGLAGRNALVTGTSRGIGGTIADALEAEGARVLRHTRSDGEITARTVVALALDNTSPTGQMFDSDGPTDW
jgi:NAD(P)-dependent dehydrogenase (short-subunit alcohol dehydrogenase family)